MSLADTVTVETAGLTTSRTGLEQRRLRSGRHSVAVAFVADLIAASTAALIVTMWFVSDVPAYASRVTKTGVSGAILIPVAAAGVWLFVLACYRLYDHFLLDSTTGTIKRVTQAALVLAALVTPTCLLFGETALIGAMVVAVPLTAVLTVVWRYIGLGILRNWQRGHTRQRTMIIGPAAMVSAILADFNRDRSNSGLTVAGACITNLDDARLVTQHSVPVYGDMTDVAGTARAAGCSAVVLAAPAELDHYRLRRMAWELSDAGIELLVSPILSDVVPGRVAVMPVGGGPLLHVRKPVFSGPQRVVKEIFDRAGAAVLLVLCALPMLAIGIGIRVTSPGPALFRQKRVGVGGKEFTCFKFRSMYIDAEARRADLNHLNERSDGLLFKVREDPRITKFGSFLRRSSLDELPQLFNVLAGSMSMVGPRPPLPSEVAEYDHDVRRRLMVKPGMTGLWQVSGRSNLSWAESVRLDLHYVDNWSPLLDVRILARTVTAVTRGTGAY
jgi:exopolysaccharide biosynthesis polyprenyl glycosylphosphotransferase